MIKKTFLFMVLAFSTVNLLHADAPYNLKARFIGTNVELSWSNGTYTNVEKLRIYKKTQHSSFFILTNLTKNSTNYTDIDVQPYTYYRYKLVTVSSNGTEIDSSAEVEISTIQNQYKNLIRFENNSASAGETIKIWYSLPDEAEAEISILNSAKDIVATYPQGQKPEGTHSFSWDLKNLNGTLVQPGIYILVLNAGKAREARKVVVKP